VVFYKERVKGWDHGCIAPVAPGTETNLGVDPIPVPFPTSYSTLCDLAVKGESLGKNAICPRCLVSGLLVFTSSWVNRIIIRKKEDGGRDYQGGKVPLAGCRNCKGRFRVLSREILPYKHFSLLIIEEHCRAYLQPDPGSPGLRKAVEGPIDTYPHYTTLYRWIEGLGERVLDRFQPETQKGLLSELWLPSSALVSESAKRINPMARDRWRQSHEIPSWKYRSSRRHDQLQACARLLDVADLLFPNAPHPLAAWQGKIIEYFNVAGWWFPSGYNCTTFQLSTGGSYPVRYAATLKPRKKEVNHGSRSPPDGLVSF
jgi:hypothetical protein